MEDDDYMKLTPPEIRDAAKVASLELLPEISRKNYEIAYNKYVSWRQTKNVSSFSEDTVLVYFTEIATKYKSSTLWTNYSMLKSTLSIKHNVDIDKYPRLHALLKRRSENYDPKKSEALTGEQIDRFIKEAPDFKYLGTKVALIMGVMGACRSCELKNMKIEDLRCFEGCFQVNMPLTKTKVPRNFTIVDDFFKIVKKYIDLRPENVPQDFFLNFQKGKCTKQVMGINKLVAMGKQIATFLQLPNPERYCLRRSSATFVADSGASMTTLKRHEGWKSASTAEGYIANSKKNKIQTAEAILSQINNDNCVGLNNPSYSASNRHDSVLINSNSNFSLTTSNLNDVAGAINISNCNVTIDYINK